MSEQYKCNKCGYVFDMSDMMCSECGDGFLEPLRWTKGGDGSHWEGCEEVHWDCKIAQLENAMRILADKLLVSPVGYMSIQEYNELVKMVKKVLRINDFDCNSHNPSILRETDGRKLYPTGDKMSELKECPFCGGEARLVNCGSPMVVCLHGCCQIVNDNNSVERWSTRPIEDGLRAELARRDEELAELNDRAVFIQFENEDELPAEIKDDVYSAMFECSHVDGVRLFPYIEENGQKYFLVMLKEVV